MIPYVSLRDRPYKCTYNGCSHRFATMKEMKHHKATDPDHFYCKKCDVDCEDWNALIQHKVDVMAPYIEKKVRARDVPPKHVVCEFCGMDFETFGGRKLHRAKAHPADQDLECPAPHCSTRFVRASHLVRHLENGECKEVSPRQFFNSIQQKHVVRQIMVDPHAFRESLKAREEQAVSVLRASDGSQADDDGDTAGGVSLLDQPDDVDGNLPPPLQAGSPIGSSIAAQSDTASDTWPCLPNIGKGDGKEGSVCGHVPAIGLGGTNDNARGTNGPADTRSTRAWSTSTPAGALFFAPSSTTVPPGRPDQALREQRLDDHNNMLKARFWDPDAPGSYNVAPFYNKALNSWVCPFADCDLTYDAEKELTHHISVWHARVQYRCLCLKLFDTAADLVAHTESPGGKCQAQKSPSYKGLIHIMTGGFLRADQIEQPEILAPNDPAKAGTDMGIMVTKFAAQALLE